MLHSVNVDREPDLDLRRSEVMKCLLWPREESTLTSQL